MTVMTDKDKIWYLESFNFFSELSMEERTFICQNTLMKTIEKGETVYFQDSPANSVYFLKEGRIRASRFHDAGDEFVIALLGPGEIFGESSITGGAVRKEAAIAEEKTLVCVMKEEDMKKLLFMSPVLNFKFTQMIEQRLERTQKRLEDLIFKNNTQRIIGFLLDLAARSGEKKDGLVTIKNSFTHEKIAQLTCTNRQEVSSLLSQLKKKKIIDYNRQYIRIFELEDLRVDAGVHTSA